jgi:hypothetical protein
LIWQSFFLYDKERLFFPLLWQKEKKAKKEYRMGYFDIYNNSFLIQMFKQINWYFQLIITKKKKKYLKIKINFSFSFFFLRAKAHFLLILSYHTCLYILSLCIYMCVCVCVRWTSDGRRRKNISYKNLNLNEKYVENIEFSNHFSKYKNLSLYIYITTAYRFI